MGASRRRLFLVRTAMISGILAFAAAVAWLRSRGAAPTATDRAASLRTMALGASLLAAVALVFLRTRLGGLSADRSGSVRVIAWAVGEFAAIFGLASVLMTGADALAAPGLIVFALALVLFPVPEA